MADEHVYNRTPPIRDKRDVVHATYLHVKRTLRETDCGLVCVRRNWSVLDHKEVHGVYLPMDTPITCLECLAVAFEDDTAVSDPCRR